jgi:phytoene desaturase
LLQYTELADGVWFPIGGLFRVVESLVAIAERHSVEFLYNSPVQQVQVEGRRATGVILEDGSQLSADVIVANADLPYVYDHLLPDRAAAERLQRKKYTCSAIMFYWGVDKVFPQLGHHNIFLSGDYRGSFDRIFKDKTLPGEPSFYVHAPARTDSTAAPTGHDTLLVLVPVGHLEEGVPQDWEVLQSRARAAVLSRLTDCGVTDLDAHLKFETVYTPRDWRDTYNLAKGAAFSLSHDFWQVGYLRPRNQHSRYRNLYFAGGSTHPGTGLPMVLLSAGLTTERILADAGVRQAALHSEPLPA